MSMADPQQIDVHELANLSLQSCFDEDNEKQYLLAEEAVTFFNDSSSSRGQKEHDAGGYTENSTSITQEDAEIVVVTSPSLDNGRRQQRLFVVPHMDKSFSRSAFIRFWHRCLAIIREGMFVLSNVPLTVSISIGGHRDELLQETSRAGTHRYPVFVRIQDAGGYRESAVELVRRMNEGSNGLYVLIHGLNGAFRVRSLFDCLENHRAFYRLRCISIPYMHRTTALSFSMN